MVDFSIIVHDDHELVLDPLSQASEELQVLEVKQSYLFFIIVIILLVQ